MELSKILVGGDRNVILYIWPRKTLISLVFAFGALLNSEAIASDDVCNRSKPNAPDFLGVLEFCSNDFKISRYPRFEDFRVDQAKVIELARPIRIIESGSDAEWETDWRAAAEQQFRERGVNFAGHYLLVVRGCGAGCQMTMIVDVSTGQSFRPKELALLTASINPLDTETLTRLGLKGSDVLAFRPDSSLLVVAGSHGETGNLQRGVYYYHWDGKGLRLVAKTERTLRGLVNISNTQKPR